MSENLNAVPPPPVVPFPSYDQAGSHHSTTYQHKTSKAIREPFPNNPVDPQYHLPSAPKRAITPPRFNRDTLNNSDIEYSKPYVRINTFATRDNLNKMDPSEQRKRTIYSNSAQTSRVDRLYVADINFSGDGGGNAAPPYMKMTRRAGLANPNEPAYVIDTKAFSRAALVHPNARDAQMPSVDILYQNTITSDHYRQPKPHHRPPPEHSPTHVTPTLGPIEKSKPPVFDKPLRVVGTLDTTTIPGAQVGTVVTGPKVTVLKQRPELLERAQHKADVLSGQVAHALVMRYGQLTYDMQISDKPLYPHLIKPVKTAPAYMSAAEAHNAKQSQIEQNALAARPPANSGHYANAVGAEYSKYSQPPGFAPVVFTKTPALNPDDSYFPFGKNPIRQRSNAPLSPSDFHQSTIGSPLAHPEIYPSGMATSKRQELGHLVAELTKADPPKFTPLEPLQPVGIKTEGARTQSHMVSPREAASLRQSMHLTAAKVVAPTRHVDPAYQTMRASMHGSLSGTQNVKNTTQFQLRRFMDARADDVTAVRSLRF